MSNIPTQRVTIYIDVHSHRACHQVALQVRHLLYRQIDVGLLYGVVRLLNIYQKLVAVGYVAKVQVLQLRVAHHRGINAAIHQLVRYYIYERILALH